MVSFDVVSLFTAIPVDKACDYIRKKLEDDLSLHSRTNLDIEDIISLLNFVLSNNFFVYNDTIYKQIHGCAMGSPVSPVVANLCMEEIEKTAINTTTVSPKFWKRYVDDSFCIIKSDAVASFHNSLNSIDQYISFTIEHESNGQLPFLDTLISRDNGKLLVDIYRKPTHTDRYLDFHSHHDRKHKISTAETLLHRALNLPNTQVGKTRETARVCAALHSNGYPKKIAADVIRKKARPPPPTPTPEELVGMFFKWVEPTNRRNFAVLPYIKGITEPLTRILKEHDIQVTSRPVKTLQQHFPIPKFRPAEDDQCNVIYKIPCASCPWSYIAKPRIIIPLRVIRTVSQHYVWCLSEGTPPINISLMNSSTTLASRTGVVWSKLDQGGNYSCIATNDVGTESETFYVSLTAFRVCVDLCDCNSSTNTFEVQNIFHCTGKNSTHILNNIPITTTQL
ncbi:uncharacterized protein [Montipora capricornis]|uniref:uncharacterized protein n=1 Tax=Montipora capricornis TaxID=246305 RepID=UPI0035F1D3DE